jgi:hypothetical protein
MSSMLKRWLIRAGELVSPGMIHNSDATINYLDVGWWMRANSYDTTCQVDRCKQLLILSPLRLPSTTWFTWNSASIGETPSDIGLG